VRAAIQEAEKCRDTGESKTILFMLSGHGNFDMGAYTDYLGGKLKDLVYDESEVAMALAGLPSIG
jgi:tryptophan synthase beta chain